MSTLSTLLQSSSPRLMHVGACAPASRPRRGSNGQETAARPHRLASSSPFGELAFGDADDDLHAFFASVTVGSAGADDALAATSSRSADGGVAALFGSGTSPMHFSLGEGESPRGGVASVIARAQAASSPTVPRRSSPLAQSQLLQRP
eukprot:CAMPEP_0198325702 /NCGR_PEP_ID=MMETSP1450-20131203/13377_1 /TAXON_ID=753684 ORGANISM="Madagascaria erythrocladiodes, Strain CCMP3234" /NCGR_SAMPLE_ID=MMETSP1450 /ASSEMBLY_ACC=CAM_ASM_001115 /LENGTH=147 /DNA_ID=CAMNT_0044029617 /DNA_START=49 /DNA_END=489 /DNA_ORIENTATION=-